MKMSFPFLHPQLHLVIWAQGFMAVRMGLGKLTMRVLRWGCAEDAITTSNLPLVEWHDAIQRSSASLGVSGPYSTELHVDSVAQLEKPQRAYVDSPGMMLQCWVEIIVLGHLLLLGQVVLPKMGRGNQALKICWDEGI